MNIDLEKKDSVILHLVPIESFGYDWEGDKYWRQQPFQIEWLENFFDLDRDLTIIQLREKYTFLTGPADFTRTKGFNFAKTEKKLRKKILSSKFSDIEEFRMFFLLHPWRDFSPGTLTKQIITLTDDPLKIIFEKSYLRWIFRVISPLITENHVKKFLKTGENIELFLLSIVMEIKDETNPSFFIPEIIEQITPLFIYEHLHYEKWFIIVANKYTRKFSSLYLQSLEQVSLEMNMVKFKIFLRALRNVLRNINTIEII